ncbi:MAG: YajQ family cyclic di-GMP-binding protein [Rhodospirillaceae bacterium]|nr:YajQ family cyclic di-GMP-binding protein [Rhodospirillaceae bacterium]|tara:strand:+ start:14879 stop:15364 length:486 start_codon:yes stop_codon:yes gene_type:complete
MPSFDIVSRIKIPEVDNAIQSALREMNNRFDFKGSACSIERNDQTLQLLADNDLKLRQVQELLRGHLAKRKVEVGFLDFQTPEKAFGNSLRQNVVIKQGVERELAQKITKTIKASKKKVQVAIQGEELRVTGKKRDDLQAAMSLIKEQKFVQPLQYVNFRD